ncbi:MAG: metal-sensing transcriptional repressor [Clostridia bacterium]|nr:metal-sensing transcriptional repressor [Clostridia bacterium]
MGAAFWEFRKGHYGLAGGVGADTRVPVEGSLAIEEDRDCAEVLVQLSATRSALTGLGKEIINEHIAHCITHAVEDGDMEAIEEFRKAIEKFF